MSNFCEMTQQRLQNGCSKKFQTFKIWTYGQVLTNQDVYLIQPKWSLLLTLQMSFSQTVFMYLPEPNCHFLIKCSPLGSYKRKMLLFNFLRGEDLWLHSKHLSKSSIHIYICICELAFMILKLLIKVLFRLKCIRNEIFYFSEIKVHEKSEWTPLTISRYLIWFWRYRHHKTITTTATVKIVTLLPGDFAPGDHRGARPKVLQNSASSFPKGQAVLIEKNKIVGLMLIFQCHKFYVLQDETFYRINSTVWDPCSISRVRIVGNPENNWNFIWELNSIAYGGGVGGFLSHTTRILGATLKPLKLWLPNLVTSCFYFFVTIWENVTKIDRPGGGGCYCHFSNERSWQRTCQDNVTPRNGPLIAPLLPQTGTDFAHTPRTAFLTCW